MQEAASSGAERLEPVPAEKKQRRTLWGAGILVLGFLLFFLLGIYGFQWHDPVTRAVSAVIPFPAARADGDWISYHSVLREEKVLREYILKDDAAYSEDVLHLATEGIVRRSLISRMARKAGIEVSEEEIRARFEMTVKNEPVDISSDEGRYIRSWVVALIQLQKLSEAQGRETVENTLSAMRTERVKIFIE
ncbi:MAG: ribonuclease III domain-containing protein [bacterium]|nr:ribonuclease III domain-containing protein [bacterium]